ncbi:structure-specific endonuclease subunit SLX4 isoform X2 [Morone saxatilis]|uniref:structure-specific endonuclease subunit SLX4 isoform X2 n=1 Tax=Morone saxatilis TaxID=34816 RepID=UPI0015E2194D|nr:structure-specific endonuclease subunit SLX4 isoform X2 [Morone saxatilis]
MDDSDQDFVDLCSKLLKRIRKKPGEPKQPRRAEPQPSSQTGDRDKRRRNNKREGDSGSKSAGSQSVCAAAEQHEVCGETGPDSRDAGSSAERGLAAKDKVLHRMQQFKRVSPPRMGHKDQNHCAPPPPVVQRQDTAESSSSGLHPEPQDSDEALALRLQQELDREAADVQTVDLEDGGLFFCQICHRDLSHMTPEGRTQHLNRCLDDSEESAPAAPPPGVPDCPICGKKFKSRKSRSAHLKRCSSDMGVPPAVLLQVLQRQTEETQSVPTASTLTETGGTKRKGSSKPGLPTRKKPRKNTEPLDEDTMVALALSSSLLEQERESERQLQTETAVSHFSLTPVLKWRPDAGKGRGKRKKGAVPRPPPLLLVQDAEAALTRMQERVSALLLRSRAPSPPTPTRCPSRLANCGGAAPLWQKSTLLEGGSTCLSDFYTPELREFITPWQPALTEAASSSTINKPESSVQPASEGTSVARPGPSTLPSSTLPSSTLPSSSSAPSTPGTGQLPVGSQAFRDLMELAEDGMTFTQYGYTASGPDEGKSAGPITTLHLSGFVPEESEERGDLCMSGFVPEKTHKRSDDTDSQARRLTGQHGANKERGSHRSAALSRLASDLSSMVNNPQLSDVQLQVDSGEVYFAHSFVVYARCPLLAEMVHESGFGVQEEGMPAAQRVLMSDVPGQAVFALLRYLYTAHCSIPASLQPHVLELASRFDLQELHQLCELHRDDAATYGDEEDDMHQDENVNNQTDQAFMELLRSMWNEEDEDNEGTDTDGRSDEEKGLKEDHQADHLAAADREICEEKVNEEELEEIYDFAATQRKREEEQDSMEEEDGIDEEEVFTKLLEPKKRSTCLSIKNQLEPDPSLDRSYNRLFSDSWGVYEEGDPLSVPSTSGQPTLFQSSASVVDDLSLSPPPSVSNLPVPGQSPGQVGDWGTDALNRDVPQEGLHLRRDSQGRHSICVPLSSDSPQKQKEPELIVLSDSGEEMEVVLSSRSPSPHSPCAVQSYTQINPRSVLKPNEPALENKKSSLEFSPDDPSSPVQSHPGSGCDQSLVDCSPEVSWLIPSTPLQHQRSVTTSSTQTKSSMCRTQLFPKDDVSSSSVFSSPALPFNNRLQTSSSPGRVPPDVGVFAVPPSQAKHSRPSNSTSSKQDTPLHLHPQPYSSTPLHTELLLPPVHLSSSPLHSNLDTVGSTSQGRDRAPSVSPDKTELGSFHLSPLSDRSVPPSSSSNRGLQSSQRQSDSSRQSRQSVESSSHNNTGLELKRTGIRDEEGEREMDCENKDTDEEGQQEEVKAQTEVAEVESTFQQSFMAMDEPPIAFNDSWGFNVCVDENPGCFSLRLEDSRGSSQQERSPGQRETAGSSSSTDCQPPKSSLSVRLLNSHGSVTSSSPSKAHSRQPSTSVQAHTGQSFTLSPPHPTTGTTPEINDSLLDSKIWDSWDEDEEEALPLSQRVNPSAHLKTPTPHNKRRRTLVPITPMPHYSDMDTPDLKNKLNRFGVRPLPKRQMILKLKEIHQYTHQLAISDSEDEEPSVGHVAQRKAQPTSPLAAGNKPVSCAQTAKFKEPRVPAATSPLKHNREEDAELLSASQGSNTSSTAASEESERSNPELCLSSDVDSDSDGGFSASQTATRLQDRLRAVRSFILSDSRLYTQILQYQPLVLSQLQQRLKAAGIRLGAAKLVDYLDSQCITFTTAKPGHSAPGRRRGKRTGRGAKAAGENGASRKRGVPAMQ